jgi:hypothetical protein
MFAASGAGINSAGFTHMEDFDDWDAAPHAFYGTRAPAI